MAKAVTVRGVEHPEGFRPERWDVSEGRGGGTESFPTAACTVAVFCALTPIATAETAPPPFAAPPAPQGSTPVWHSLDLRYDQCVGHCECMPGRSVGDLQVSAHFSCIPIGEETRVDGKGDATRSSDNVIATWRACAAPPPTPVAIP
jgi:hypothetical protein